MILKRVNRGSKVYTDQASGYDGLAKQYAHGDLRYNRMQRYVDGRVHTNGMENFWSLLKRSLKGTYVAVEPFILTVTLMSKYSVITTGPRKQPVE